MEAEPNDPYYLDSLLGPRTFAEAREQIAAAEAATLPESRADIWLMGEQLAAEAIYRRHRAAVMGRRSTRSVAPLIHDINF